MVEIFHYKFIFSPEFVDQMMIFLNKVSGFVSVALTDGFVWVPVWIQCEEVSLQMLIHLEVKGCFSE